MKSQATILAVFAAGAYAQSAYPAPAAPSYGAPAPAPTYAPSPPSYTKCPAAGEKDSKGRYSCNPAHQYPAGQVCKSVDGCYFLETTTSTTTSTTTTAPPAPTYPANDCPQPGSTNSKGYGCNPAHQYPAGQTCDLKDKCYILVEHKTSTTAAPPAPTYPANDCPQPGSTNSKGYGCNPAHQYPAGQTCESKDNCYILVEHKTSTTAAPPAPTYPAPSPPKYDDCAKKCATAYDKCRGTRVNGLSANQAQCASEYASCLNFNPFTQSGSSFVTPTTCAPTTTAPPQTTTTTTAAPQPPKYDDCAKTCATAYDKCRSTRVNGLSANQAQCASEYAACLNFNPFTQSGSSFVTPTTCAPKTTVATTQTTQAPPPTYTTKTSPAPAPPANTKPAPAPPANTKPAPAPPANTKPATPAPAPPAYTQPSAPAPRPSSTTPSTPQQTTNAGVRTDVGIFAAVAMVAVPFAL